MNAQPRRQSHSEAVLLQTQQLAIGYQKTQPLLQNINLSLRAGQFACLLGPNGAGKSTLLRTLAGMQPPLAGHVLLNDENISTLRPRQLARRLSVVLTERVDVPVMPAYSIVALGRYPYTGWRGRLQPHDQAVVDWALEAVDAVSLADRNIGELSDGERQKIMIARALAQEPQVMLLDEPTAFLDLPRRVEMMQILRRLAHEQQRAVLLSTHDLDLALRTADAVWLMSGGRITTGAPEDLVLSGAFADAFAAEGVAFDPHSGAFRLRQARDVRVDVIGDGLAAEWATRALKRAGYAVDNGGADARVQVVCRNGSGPPRWQIVAPVEQQPHHSIEALLTAVERLASADDDLS